MIMKNIKTSTLRALLLLALFGTAMQAAAYDFVEDGIYYNVNEDGVTVTVSYKAYWTEGIISYSGDVVIPSTVTHNGVTYTVTAVGESAFESSDRTLTSVTLPETITSIGEYAFCTTQMSSIELPQSLTSIGDYAFAGSLLTTVTLPDNVSSLGRGVFAGCGLLKSVTLGRSIDNRVWMYHEFCYCERIETVICRGLTPPQMGVGSDNNDPNPYNNLFNFFDTVLKNAILYVPRESLSAYQSADQWKGFVHIRPFAELPCDLNCDGEVNIADVNAIINSILSQDNDMLADVNGDGEISLADVNAVIDAVLNQQ